MVFSEPIDEWNKCTLKSAGFGIVLSESYQRFSSAASAEIIVETLTHGISLQETNKSSLQKVIVTFKQKKTIQRLDKCLEKKPIE